MATRVEVDGAASIARGFGRTIADLDRLPDNSADVARRVRDEAARAAPNRTGLLARSGRVTRSGSASFATFGSSSVRYAPAQNWGIGPRTGLRGPHNIRATHFFSDAVSRNAKGYSEDIADGIQESLDEIRGA